MPSRTFPCGHRGRGRHCHACAQAATEADRRARDRADAEAPRRALIRRYGLREADRVPLEACRAALAACDRLAADAPYRSVGGKVLEATGLLSVPLGLRWRLVCEPVGRGRWRPLRLLSHEAYNTEIKRR